MADNRNTSSDGASAVQSSSSSIRVPKDVWQLITRSANSDKIYIVTTRCGTNPMEVGAFKDKDDAYKIACTLLANYYMGYCASSNNPAGFQRIFNFVYLQILPDPALIRQFENVKYPTNYVDLLKYIGAFGPSLSSGFVVEVNEKKLL